MAQGAQDAYDELIRRSREISVLASCGSVLGWDRETYMPKQGAEHRSEQLGLISGLCHEKFTDPEIGDLLAAVEGTDLVAERLSDAAVNVRETRRAYDRASRVTSHVAIFPLTSPPAAGRIGQGDHPRRRASPGLLGGPLGQGGHKRQK